MKFLSIFKCIVYKWELQIWERDKLVNWWKRLNRKIIGFPTTTEKTLIIACVKTGWKCQFNFSKTRYLSRSLGKSEMSENKDGNIGPLLTAIVQQDHSRSLNFQRAMCPELEITMKANFFEHPFRTTYIKIFYVVLKYFNQYLTYSSMPKNKISFKT